MTKTLATLFCLFLIGCSTTSVQSVVTPQRVEAVTAFGVYVAAVEVYKDNRQSELNQALAGLKTLQAAGSHDMVAIAAALSAADLKWIDTQEGTLFFGALISVFTDNFGVQQTLDSKYANAVLNGAVRGIQLALDRAKTVFEQEAVDILSSEARATR